MSGMLTHVSTHSAISWNQESHRGVCWGERGWLTYNLEAVRPAPEVHLRLLPNADNLDAHPERLQLLVALLRLSCQQSELLTGGLQVQAPQEHRESPRFAYI